MSQLDAALAQHGQAQNCAAFDTCDASPSPSGTPDEDDDECGDAYDHVDLDEWPPRTATEDVSPQATLSVPVTSRPGGPILVTEQPTGPAPPQRVVGTADMRPIMATAQFGSDRARRLYTSLLRRATLAQDGTCRMPGCARTPRFLSLAQSGDAYCCDTCAVSGGRTTPSPVTSSSRPWRLRIARRRWCRPRRRRREGSCRRRPPLPRLPTGRRPAPALPSR